MLQMLEMVEWKRSLGRRSRQDLKGALLRRDSYVPCFARRVPDGFIVIFCPPVERRRQLNTADHSNLHMHLCSQRRTKKTANHLWKPHLDFIREFEMHFFTWLLIACRFGLTIFQRVTIDPSGTIREKQGTPVSLRASIPIIARNPRIIYNRIESPVIPSSPVGVQVNVYIPPFEAFATFIGENATDLFFQLDFMLLVKYNDASIGIVSTTGLATNVYSPFLNLTVLSSPCCNVSGSTVERNTTDSPELLRLNCSEIIRERGNPPAFISWTLQSPASGCRGMPSGEANQIYNIDQISRSCNGAKITCVADTYDALLDITTTTFNVLVKSPPGSLICTYDGLARPLAIFSWKQPEDNGEFQVTHYSLSVNGSSVDRKQNSSLNYGVQVKDGDQISFSVSAVSILGSGGSCEIHETIPTRSCILPIQSAACRTSITVNCPSNAVVRSAFFVYYSGNGTTAKKSAISLPTTISNLLSNMNYVVTVEAENSEGDPENSSSVVMSTTEPGSPCSVSLTKDSVKEISLTSSTLEFLSVADSGRDNVAVATYRIYVDNLPRDFPAQAGNIQRIRIDGLTTGRAYAVQATAINEIGEEGDKSPPIAIATLTDFDQGATPKIDQEVSYGVLAGSVVGSLLAGVLIGIVPMYVVMNRLAKSQAPEESVEMKDSRLYAESRRKPASRQQRSPRTKMLATYAFISEIVRIPRMPLLEVPIE
ncbi:uncharacterized protein [Oscarella lobularis]|uniref:uncharacterized protein isoform X2 n=1 Tax=Oscarella lobularis TaxID=121494 RepID=UPI00331353DE